MTLHCELASEEDTERLARLLNQVLPAHMIVALDGTLGAGKTRLVRAFAEACGVSADDVTSPTFTLWQTYNGSRLIHHLDAYRVADEDEFDALGFEECLDAEAVTFVEWASRVEVCLPSQEERLGLKFEVLSEMARKVTITAPPQVEAALQKHGVGLQLTK